MGDKSKEEAAEAVDDKEGSGAVVLHTSRKRAADRWTAAARSLVSLPFPHLEFLRGSRHKLFHGRAREDRSWSYQGVIG